MVLEKGRIVEYDKPERLLQNEDSLFYQLSKDAGIIHWKTWFIYATKLICTL